MRYFCVTYSFAELTLKSHMRRCLLILDDYAETVTMYGSNYTAYSHSYLCYGLNEAQRQLFAHLVRVSSFVVFNTLLYTSGSRGSLTGVRPLESIFFFFTIEFQNIWGYTPPLEFSNLGFFFS